MAAGWVGAAAYLGLFGVFVGQMTGTLSSPAAAPAVGRAGSLAKVVAVPAFLLGAFASGLTARAAGRAGRSPLPLLCVTWSALVGCFAASALVGAPFIRPEDKAAIAVAAIGAFAMGRLSALSRAGLSEMPSAVVRTTNVTTGMVEVVETLSGTERARGPLARIILTVAAFGLGPMVGALAFERAGFVCLFAAVVLGLGFALLARGAA